MNTNRRGVSTAHVTTLRRQTSTCLWQRWRDKNRKLHDRLNNWTFKMSTAFLLFAFIAFEGRGCIESFCTGIFSAYGFYADK